MAPQDVANAGYEALMKGELCGAGCREQGSGDSSAISFGTAQAKLNENEEVPPEKRTRERGDLDAMTPEVRHFIAEALRVR